MIIRAKPRVSNRVGQIIYVTLLCFFFFGINKLTETLFCLAYKYDDIATLSELLSI